MPETEEVKAKAREVTGQTQERAKQAGGQAKERMREQVDQRSTQAGEQVRSTASDVRSVADELRKQGKDAPARYAEQAADRAERVGDYLRDCDGDRILHDVEDFARRKPWAIAAGGLALGFAASRLLKASSAERYRSSRGDGAYDYAYRGGRLPGAVGGEVGQGAGGRFAREQAGEAGAPLSDREPGGPTASPAGTGAATGGATGARASDFEPHR